MYRFFIRPLLFLVDPETIHHFTFNFLKAVCSIPGIRGMLSAFYSVNDPRLAKTLFGIKFKNPVGLAAGLDKDAKLIDELSTFGFGFIEIGTITPKPQPGNDKPRLFRLPADQGLINRMGFNNRGAIHAAGRLKERTSDVVIGGNIGKNKVTPNEEAINDYESCFETLYPYVDYFVVNVSSPNTPGLRDLQEKEPLKKLLLAVKMLSNAKPKPKPVLLKIAPDLTLTQLDDIVEILKESGTDGVIATNTTISREGLTTSKEVVEKIGAGGLSGKPLRQRSTEVIAYLRAKLGQGFPIIGVGGIMSEEDAIEKLKAGADLVQIYTGFIYEGPGFVKRILKKIRKAGG
ncbi:MAG TPA: quinone-dependent dihydroorotate dehydrogenase [Cyclobacteriaceae bacterium]|nr:quinone-dependent dihydroorotate dehydrogenase [Cyclobacteriaceae bacterium]